MYFFKFCVFFCIFSQYFSHIWMLGLHWIWLNNTGFLFVQISIIRPKVKLHINYRDRGTLTFKAWLIDGPIISSIHTTLACSSYRNSSPNQTSPTLIFPISLFGPLLFRTLSFCPFCFVLFNYIGFVCWFKRKGLDSIVWFLCH